MILNSIQDDIFKSDAKHIAFAINKEGYNDAGFAGVVASKYWNELANFGEHEIGEVFSKAVGNNTFHALVCHSLNDGWGENQDEVIKECFDNIPSNGEPVATIAIGTGFIGLISGAKFEKIVCGMHDSEQKIILHSSYSLDEIKDIYNNEKANQIRKTR